MPTYEYECQKCGSRFEVFQSMNDPRLTDCREEGCDGSVKRLIGTGAGLLFKGSGFYITDYRSDSYKAAAKKESGEGKSGGESKSGGDKKKGSDSTKSSSSPPKKTGGSSSGTSSS